MQSAKRFEMENLTDCTELADGNGFSDFCPLFLLFFSPFNRKISFFEILFLES